MGGITLNLDLPNIFQASVYSQNKVQQIGNLLASWGLIITKFGIGKADISYNSLQTL